MSSDIQYEYRTIMVAITSTVAAASAPTTHLIYPSTLPNIPNQLSVLSYNVLLPNSTDGWWNYKMYQPNESINDIDTISSWEYRSQLIKQKIKCINPDVVCMQEVSPLSFSEDFQFMFELGYDGVEMFKRGRFRPATFYKTEKCTLVADPVHKDRTLLTGFQLNNLNENDPCFGRNWYVLNCHLQAGPEGKRRVRQIEEGIKATVNLAKKMKESDPNNPLLIVCGDFNGGDESGALHYLKAGEVGPTFIEDGESVSSKIRKLPLLQPLNDVAQLVQRRNNIDNDCDSYDEAPPTLVVAELISQMVKEGTDAYQSPDLSDDMVQRLQRCYQKYASQNHENYKGNVMNKEDVEQWLIDINRKVGRGSEFRNAAKEMGWKEPKVEDNDDNEGKEKEKPKIYIPEDGILTMDGFLNVYRDELRGGKFWGINYDLAVMGEMLPSVGIFRARFDRLFCSTALVPTVIVDTLSDVPCPNKHEPSDHLPVAASFRLSALN